MQSKLDCLWKDSSVPQSYRTAVSLHGHTNRSKEGLTFISRFAARHAVLNLALAAQKRRAQKEASVAVDFEKGYWTPPLPPLEAYRLEMDQIQNGLGLAGMVSLTDHDNIEAPMLLRVVPEARQIPVSVEWSVPYRQGVLHLGIHNLPSAKGEGMMAQFAEYTRAPKTETLRELLQMLDRDPGVLVVLNHPLWDLKGIGKMRHWRLVHDFAAEMGMFVHAFELSGVRSWQENREVVEFAETWNQTLVGGGDRHGAEANAVLNLTNAQSFVEFVDEVRRKRRSHVLFMPQYARPLTLRVFQTLLDVVREYPDHAQGLRRWDDRVYHPGRDGQIRPLASMWQRAPGYITGFFAVVGLLENPAIREAIQAILATPEHEMNLTPKRGQEAGLPWSRSYGSRTFPTPTGKSTEWRTPAGNLRRSRENAGSPS